MKTQQFYPPKRETYEAPAVVSETITVESGFANSPYGTRGRAGNTVEEGEDYGTF